MLLWALGSGGCASTPPPPKAVSLPAFVPDASRHRDVALDAAAHHLCTDEDAEGVLSDDVKRDLGIADGQLFVLVKPATSHGESRSLLEIKGKPLLVDNETTHTGVYISEGDDAEPCAALVAVRRRVVVDSKLPTSALPGDTARFRLRLFQPRKGKKGKTQQLRRRQEGGAPTLTFFAARPDGVVHKRIVDVGSDGRVDIEEPYDAGAGRYTFEVLVDDGTPEVALLWTVQAGERQRLPPAPDVLFGDEGHSDVGLTRRAEALVQRLRTQQDIDVLRIAPPLADIADARADVLSGEGRLGHRLPDGRTALDELRRSKSKFYVSHLSEVQAQASTLEEAWLALLKSPAHRYEMVHPDITHMGVSVRRGADPAGRTLVTLVGIFAKRNRNTAPDVVAQKLLQKLNGERAAKGAPALTSRSSLQKTAQAQAKAMAMAGMTDETLLDAGLQNRPVAKVALDAHNNLQNVESVLARLDDPLRLGASKAVLRAEATWAGIGVARSDVDGQWYVCVLVGQP